MHEDEDLLSRLYSRNLHTILEDIFYLTDCPRSVAACLCVCRKWRRWLCEDEMWRRLVERRVNRRSDFRLLCKLNGWTRYLPRLGGEAGAPTLYKNILYKVSSFTQLWHRDRLTEGKLYTGAIFACLKVHNGQLYAGMVDGTIKVWQLTDPLRNDKAFRVLEGHEDRVTSLDASGDSLVSGSMDHSLRVWSVATGHPVRVLRGVGSLILEVKLMAEVGRLVCLSQSCQLTYWSWTCGRPQCAELLHQTSLLDPDLGSVEVLLGDRYHVAIMKGLFRNAGAPLAVYNGQTGRRLRDTGVYCREGVLCAALYQSLLCLGMGDAVEVWNLEESCLVRTLHHRVTQFTAPSFYMHSLAMSDWMVVGMLSNGEIFAWCLADNLSGDDRSDPFLRIENTEMTWKNMTLSDSKIVFGLEVKFGDIKMFSFGTGRGPEPDLLIKGENQLTPETTTHFRLAYDHSENKECFPDLR